MAPRKPKVEADSPRKVRVEPRGNRDETMIEEQIPKDNIAMATVKKIPAKRRRKTQNASTSAPVKVSKDKVIKARQKTFHKKKALPVERSLTPVLMSLASKGSRIPATHVGEAEKAAEDDEAGGHVQSYLNLKERKINHEQEEEAAIPGSGSRVNGREKGRQLVQWKRPRMAEKLLLSLQFECHRAGILLPWAKAVHRLAPGTTAASALQNLSKMRDILITEGHEVPPLIGKSGQEDPTPWVRGYARQQESGNVHQAVARLWTDPVIHLKESLQDHGLVRGSGQYRKIQRMNAFRENIIKDLEVKGKRIPKDLKAPLKYTTMAEHNARNGGGRTIYDSKSLLNGKRVLKGALEQGSEARKPPTGTKEAARRKPQPRRIKIETLSESESEEETKSDTNLPIEPTTRPRRQNTKSVNYVLDVSAEEDNQESSDNESTNFNTPTKAYEKGKSHFGGKGLMSTCPKTNITDDKSANFNTPTKAHEKGRSYFGGKGLMITPPKTSITVSRCGPTSNPYQSFQSRFSNYPFKQMLTSVVSEGASATYDQGGSDTERKSDDILNSPLTFQQNRQKLPKSYASDSMSMSLNIRSTIHDKDRDVNAIGEFEDAHSEADDEFTMESHNPVTNSNSAYDWDKKIGPKFTNTSVGSNVVVTANAPTLYYDNHLDTVSDSQNSYAVDTGALNNIFGDHDMDDGAYGLAALQHDQRTGMDGNMMLASAWSSNDAAGEEYSNRSRNNIVSSVIGSENFTSGRRSSAGNATRSYNTRLVESNIPGAQTQQIIQSEELPHSIYADMIKTGCFGQRLEGFALNANIGHGGRNSIHSNDNTHDHDVFGYHSHAIVDSGYGMSESYPEYAYAGSLDLSSIEQYPGPMIELLEDDDHQGEFNAALNHFDSNYYKGR